MTIQIKAQVLSITPRERRTYSGRAWYQRQFQCFLEDKVAVHTVNAQDGETEEALAQQKQLDSYLPGYYMASVELTQGDRGKAVFSITKMEPIPTAKQNS